MWGSVGFTFNVDLVKARLPDADFENLDTIFKPENAAKLADCGLSLHDSLRDMIPILLKYLGIDPDTTDFSQYRQAADLIKPMRQYVTAFDNENYLNGLPNGDICAAMTWSGDHAVAKSRAASAGVILNLAYGVPKTGAPLWFDVMAVPKDAPN